MSIGSAPSPCPAAPLSSCSMRCGTISVARPTSCGSGPPSTRTAAIYHLIDWECGDRDATTFSCLLNRLKRWGVRLFCTDQYIVYEAGLAVGIHYQGKDQT